MFDKITIKNFRGIRDLEVSNLDKINIFVGDNASGKSTILDSLFIAINPNNAELVFRTNVFRGMGKLKLGSPDEDFWRSFFFQFDTSYNIEINFTGKYARNIIIKPKNVVERAIGNGELDKIKMGSSDDLQKIMGLIIQFTVSKEKYQAEIFQVHDGVPWKSD